MRTKKAIINIIANVFVQLTSIIIGLIVPKLLISNYGSTVNGLIQMITQIVSYFGIIEGGVATAAGVALYKPLLENNEEKINRIMTAVKEFYLKTGFFFLILGGLVCILYPLSIMNQIDFITSLIITVLLMIISIAGYLIFNKYNMILVSDQKHYITLISSALANILVAIVQIVLISYKVNILIVVLATPLLGIIRLLLIRKYVKTKYSYITYKSDRPDYSAIKNKWNALSLNVSQMCKIVIPLIVLNLMFDLKVVSVYSVYSMIFRVGSSLIETIGNSLTAGFGNLIAEGNNNNLRRVYDISETLIISFISIVSLGFFILTSSFIKIYIGENPDISYQCPLLAVSFIINEAILNIRFSPKIILKANGILKQVSRIAIFEIILATILTPIFCYIFGFQAVLFGSIISGVIQSIYMIVFVNKNIMKTSLMVIVRKLLVNIIGIIISYVLIVNFINIEPVGYVQFIIDGICVVIISFIVLFTLSFLFLRKHCMLIYNQLKSLVIKS